jgi:NAD(P)-dependent dehydrogenase (short-subunit alcohol dehydrogenase family)
MIEDLKGKVVLVTGGSTGIGAEVAKEFAANGAKVMVHYNASEADAKAVVDAITAKGGVAQMVKGDVIDRSQWPASPGARPGGVSVQDFFEATRVIGAHPKVRAVDLTEYDPSLEIGDLGSLTAGRWFCELLAGFQGR